MKIVFENVKGARAIAVTVVVHALSIRSVTGVTTRPVSELVGFHDVELGAPVATHLAGVTVAKVVACVIDSWHDDSVKSRNAPAANLR